MMETPNSNQIETSEIERCFDINELLNTPKSSPNKKINSPSSLYSTPKTPYRDTTFLDEIKDKISQENTQERPNSKNQIETPNTETLFLDVNELLKTPKCSTRRKINSPITTPRSSPRREINSRKNKTPSSLLNSPKTPCRKVTSKIGDVGKEETQQDDENDYSPSPFVIKRPPHHKKKNTNKKLVFDNDQISSEYDEIEKINENFFLQSKKEYDIEEPEEETDFSLFKSCFNPDKLFCNFDSNSWDLNQHKKINHFIIKNMFSKVEDIESAQLAVLMCSVSQNNHFCNRLYYSVQKTFLSYELFDSIIKNWGFDETEEINTNQDSMKISNNVRYILSLLSNSIEKYSLDDLIKCFHYMISISSDPISQYLVLEIKTVFINCIKLLLKFEITNENMLEMIKIDTAPIFLTSNILSYLTQDPCLYPLLNLSIVKSINLSLDSQINLEDTPETILKFVKHIEKSFQDLLVDNLCRSLNLMEIILSRTIIKNDSKPIFCQICEALSGLKKKTKKEDLFKAFESLRMYSHSKIKPFLTVQENLLPYFQYTSK